METPVYMGLPICLYLRGEWLFRLDPVSVNGHDTLFKFLLEVPLATKSSFRKNSDYMCGKE